MINEDWEENFAIRMLDEIKIFKDHCFYDDNIKKIVYKNATVAMQSYRYLQSEEMNKYKWIESEKAHKDLGDKVILQWITNYASDFSHYWRKTHLFIK